ncbi:MAG: thioredoxin family protein [Bacteroidetes bacterium]|nr:thioredoxin family protein [Bacteroidota bacterium]MCH8942917.1 thioredoxin family protein [Bacteroidota bacterium]
MILTLFIADECQACARVQKQVTDITKKSNNLSLQIENIKDCPNNNILIVPALYIEDELYAYGDINEKRFLKRIKAKETETGIL